MHGSVSSIMHFISTLFTERQVLVFLGAGSSTEGWQGGERFPDFSTLIRRILDEEGYGEVDDEWRCFLDIMRRWEDESDLSVRLSKYLHGNPGASHLQLASAAMSLYPHVDMAVYLTTNFDDLMYKAFLSVTKGAPERDPRVFSLSNFIVASELSSMFRAIPRHARQGSPVILKLFGDLNSKSPIFHKENMPIDEFVASKLQPLFDLPVIFIGYALRDAPILKMLSASRSNSPIYIVSPIKCGGEIEEIIDRRIYWIEKTFSEFITEFVTLASAKSSDFERSFNSFLSSADATFLTNSYQAIRDLGRAASAAAHTRYRNRARVAHENASQGSVTPVQRPDTGPDFAGFLRSGARVMGIIGESGSGKSTLISQFYEHQVAENNNIAVYYDAQSFRSGASLTDRLAIDLMADPLRLKQAIARIAEALRPTGCQLLVLIDALNETSQISPLTLRYEIEELAGEAPDNIRFIFTCRRVFWDASMNLANDLPAPLYHEGKLFILSRFSPDEAEAAYDRFRIGYSLKSEFRSLSLAVRHHVRDPLMLRFVAEAYRNSALPNFAPSIVVFQRVMDTLRRRYMHTPLVEYLEVLAERQLDRFMNNEVVGDIYLYKDIFSDGNLSILAQQQQAAGQNNSHPITIFEDENIITPLDGGRISFKFTYERFYEYVIGLQIGRRLLDPYGCDLLPFLKKELQHFGSAHYSMYQGLRNALIVKYMQASNAADRTAIARLILDPDPRISALGKDVLREVIFEADEDGLDVLAAVCDDMSARLSLFLELGYEAEGILPYAVSGLFHDNITIRRKSAFALISHLTTFSSRCAMEEKICEAIDARALSSSAVATGLFYACGIILAVNLDKSEAFEEIGNLLRAMMARHPERIGIASLASALRTVVEQEGPLFFGANYGADGLFHPWARREADFDQRRRAVKRMLQNPAPEHLIQEQDVILFFSNISTTNSSGDEGAKIFAYQIEYRIVQWMIIRAWKENRLKVLSILDGMVEFGRPYNIDFSLGILEHVLIDGGEASLDVITKCHSKMLTWLEQFERHPDEFYRSLAESDPFSFNLAPLAMVAHVEARFLTTDGGSIPSVFRWLLDPSPQRQKMALLAANWLSSAFPKKVLTTLQGVLRNDEMADWIDRVLAEFERHSPRLLDEFFDEMKVPIHRRMKIRGHSAAKTAPTVQYHGGDIFRWLFLGPQNRLNRVAEIYELLYSGSSVDDFFRLAINLLIDNVAVSVEQSI
jgi:GTPase SAR1 family protein